MGFSLRLLPTTNSKIVSSPISAMNLLAVHSLVFQTTFIVNDDDIDKWMNDYDPHISLLYAEKNTSAIIGKIWEGGRKS